MTPNLNVEKFVSIQNPNNIINEEDPNHFFFLHEIR